MSSLSVAELALITNNLPVDDPHWVAFAVTLGTAQQQELEDDQSSSKSLEDDSWSLQSFYRKDLFTFKGNGKQVRPISLSLSLLL
jgi:hypothetical protein